MSLKLFLFLTPVALGGYYVANRGAAPAAGAETAKAGTASVAAPRRSWEECNAMERQLLEANAPGDGNPLAAIAALTGVERELRRRGCDTRNGYGRGNAFRQPGNRMGAAPSPAMGSAPPGAGAPGQLHTSFDAPNGSPTQGTSFEPGRPMVEVGRNRSR